MSVGLALRGVGVYDLGHVATHVDGRHPTVVRADIMATCHNPRLRPVVGTLRPAKTLQWEPAEAVSVNGSPCNGAHRRSHPRRDATRRGRQPPRSTATMAAAATPKPLLSCRRKPAFRRTPVPRQQGANTRDWLTDPQPVDLRGHGLRRHFRFVHVPTDTTLQLDDAHGDRYA